MESQKQGHVRGGCAVNGLGEKARAGEATQRGSEAATASVVVLQAVLDSCVHVSSFGRQGFWGAYEHAGIARWRLVAEPRGPCARVHSQPWHVARGTWLHAALPNVLPLHAHRCTRTPTTTSRSSSTTTTT